MKLDATLFVRISKQDRRRLEKLASKATKETGYQIKTSQVARQLIQEGLDGLGL